MSGFSVVIPHYNNEKYLLEAIRSITTQPFEHEYEIIVVDDRSQDEESLRVLAKAEAIDRVKIHYLKKNEGVQHARNKGLEQAKYPYCFMLDADDRLNTGESIVAGGTYADRSIDVLSNDSDVAFVQSLTKMFGDFSGLTISSYPISEQLVVKKHHVPTEIMFRTEDALAAGGYNEEIKKWQDWSFGVALMNYRIKNQKLNKVHFLPQPYIGYRIHNTSERVSSQNVSERKMIEITVDSYSEIFAKHYSELSASQIVDKVYASKPTKLEELIYVSNDSLERALEMMKERNYSDIEGAQEEFYP